MLFPKLSSRRNQGYDYLHEHALLSALEDISQAVVGAHLHVDEVRVEEGRHPKDTLGAVGIYVKLEGQKEKKSL
jgi:hypothetical protein